MTAAWVRWLLIGLAILAAPAGRAIAQDYPTRPVTIVLPYTAGGAVEAVARLLGERLAQRLGRPFVIENRPGAGTGIAASYVAHAAPDGHTLLLATSTTMAINVGVYRNLAYDPLKDLAPVALVAGVSFVLVVNPSLGIQSMADFIRVAKSTPGGLAYASFGHGSAAHLYAEMLKTMTGIEGTHIPYKGSPPALNDIVGGHVPWMFGDFATAMPLVRAGKLVALGTSTAARVAAAPDVPPVADAVPGYDASAWQMIVAPAGTPREIIVRLNDELRRIVGEPDTQKEFSLRGFIPIVTPPPADLETFVKSEILRWGEVVKKAGAAGIE
jgi:tripartite-type tricarboxylate transporter receptor subunit TctC